MKLIVVFDIHFETFSENTYEKYDAPSCVDRLLNIARQ